MLDASPRWDDSCFIADQLQVELTNPTRASRRASHAAKRRAASGRRWFVNPTPCERTYSNIELEFIQAMQDYKQRSCRQFPTGSEVLQLLQNLRYREQA